MPQGGAVTELVAQGAMNKHLNTTSDTTDHGNAKTFHKSKHTKHTNFAMESVAQPFNTMVAFGKEAQVTLNRTGDLISHQYVVIDLPGITVCESDSRTCGVNNAQFPTCANPCNPGAEADKAVYGEYIGAQTSAKIGNDVAAIHDPTAEQALYTAEVDRRLSALGRAKFRRDLYDCCAPIDCCSPCEDCPDNCCNQKVFCQAQGRYVDPADPNDNCEDFPELGEGEEPAPQPWAHWANAVGQLLIRNASIVIGGTTVDTVYSDFMYMWEELSGQPGKRLLEMVGKRHTRTQLVCDSRCKRRLYVPLPFWYTQASGSSLSLTSLQFHGVQLTVTFEDLQKLIVMSHNSINGNNLQVLNCATGCCLTAADLSAHVLSTYVYLDTPERHMHGSASHETLIHQLQTTSVQTTNQQVNLSLNFNHPVIELIWAVRRQAHENCNNWFNFSGIDGRDPISKASLTLNSQSRFSHEAPYFRLVQPYQHHTNVPDTFVYSYSFALQPENSETPSGSCNFSRIDHVDLSLTLQPHLGKEQVTVIVFAKNHNIFRYRDGLGGCAFAT